MRIVLDKPYNVVLSSSLRLLDKSGRVGNAVTEPSVSADTGGFVAVSCKVYSHA